jgi:dynein heavy chain
VTKMDIVLFRDAIIHISKIYRVINFNRGHCLLVGVGGSGRHSLTRLAAYISDMSSDYLQIRSDFSLRDFRFKLQSMYRHAAFGQKQPKTVFIFSDNDVVDEVFLEDIQNQLNGGIVPNIFNTEDLYKIKDEVTFKKEYKRDGQTSENPDLQTEWLYRRIKDNMHLSICMSPIGEKFRNYTRMYPALINNTTIDWFMPWPLEALTEVADRFIGIMEIDQKFKSGLSQLSAYLHFVAQKEADDMKKELRRIFYVTPTNFVELLKGYDKIIRAKRNEIGANITKLDTGLTKLEKAAEEVREMTAEA